MSETTLNILIAILKYISITVGTMAGVAGLYIDFKNKKTNKISKKGYIILTLIISAGIITLLLQSFELARDNINAEKTASMSLKQGRINNKILTDLTRTLRPLNEIRLTFFIEIPINDSKLAEYKKRLEMGLDSIMLIVQREAEKIKDDENKYFELIRLYDNYGLDFTGSAEGGGVMVEVTPDSPLYPSESLETLAYYTMFYGQLNLSFFRDSTLNVLSDSAQPDLNLRINTGLVDNGLSGLHNILFSSGTRQLYITARAIVCNSKCWRNSVNTSSTIDLLGSRLLISLPSNLVFGSKVLDDQIFELRKKFNLVELTLEIEKSRYITIRNPKSVESDTGLPEYLYNLPKTDEELNQLK